MKWQAKIDSGERGTFNPKNKLNDLTGKEWIKFTKSWFIHRPPRRQEDEILHPAKFPETLVEEFIRFFTKGRGWVLDPFLGTGSTLIACAQANRNGVGIELHPKYHTVAKRRVDRFKRSNPAYGGINSTASQQYTLLGDSLELKNILCDHPHLRNRCFDYCITSPPYWNQLKRNTMRQKERVRKGWDTKYSEIAADLGNIERYEEFLEVQAHVFDAVYDVMNTGAYLTIITNNVYSEGRLYPLAFDTAISLTKRGERSWVLKDERIWLQDDKALMALGINSAWVGNRHHQYCLIFRKES